MSDTMRPNSSMGSSSEDPGRNVSTARLQKIIHRLESKLQPLSAENSELRQRLELASLDIELAEEKSASSQSDLDAAISSIAGLQLELGSVSEQLSDARVVAEKLTIENADQEAALESLRQQLSELEALREVNEELSELHSSRERELLHEIQTLQHSLARSRNQFEQAQARIAELEALVVKQKESWPQEAAPIDEQALLAEITDLKLKLKLANVELQQFSLELLREKFGAAATLASKLQYVEQSAADLSQFEKSDPIFREAIAALFDQLREETLEHDDLKQAFIEQARQASDRAQMQGEPDAEEHEEDKPINDEKDIRIEELQNELKLAKEMLDAATARAQVLESQAMRARKLAKDLEELRAELVATKERSSSSLQTVESLKNELAATAAELHKSLLADLPADLHSAAVKSRIKQTQSILVSVSRALLQRSSNDLAALPDISLEPHRPLRFTPKMARHPIVQACWDAIDNCGSLGVAKDKESLVETRLRLSTQKRLLSVILAGGAARKLAVGQLP